MKDKIYANVVFILIVVVIIIVNVVFLKQNCIKYKVVLRRLVVILVANLNITNN